MDLSQFAAICGAEYGRHHAGTWHTLDERLTGWSSKPTRPWLVVVDDGTGPLVQMMPRSTQDWGGPEAIKHGPHQHGEMDSDRRTCRINETGRIVSSTRKGFPRAWIEDGSRYSCLEPDDGLLELLGCRR